MKTENWNGCLIRFVDVEGEWWAVGKDVAEALGYANTRDALSKRVDEEDKGVANCDTLGGKQDLVVINEIGLYSLIVSSNLPAAKQFKRWVFETLKTLREASNLEGYQVFTMLDKEHQKQAMDRLQQSLGPASNAKDFIKANQIANKAVANKYGYPKAVKKNDMTPEMKVDREAILDNVVELMAVKEKYGLNISVKEKIYEKFGGHDLPAKEGVKQ